MMSEIDGTFDSPDPAPLVARLEQLRRDAIEGEKAGHFSASFRLGYDSALLDVKRYIADHLQAREAQIAELVDKWRDPEFWKDEGSRMDSADCARELAALLSPEGRETTDGRDPT